MNLTTSHPGYYKAWAKNGIYDDGKVSNVISVVGIDAAMPDCCLCYSGSLANSSPLCAAIGIPYPSGGSFSWSFTSSDGGYISFIDGQYTDICCFRGTSPGHIELMVTYTLGGVSVSKTSTVKVAKISTTDSTRGHFTIATGYKDVFYYHKLYDQDGQFIDCIGVPCEESLHVFQGRSGQEHPGNSDYFPSDGYGTWPGGVCVRDSLKYLTYDPESKVGQGLTCGGWSTSPYYYIRYDQINLWKNTSSTP
ncbi:MAG: hypothetical protein P8016_06175 [Sedimentisphaerales bacterium]